MKGPLRKIVGYEREIIDLKEGGTVELIREKLECGHLQPPVLDIYGPTNAYRRRCWRCKRLQTQKAQHY